MRKTDLKPLQIQDLIWDSVDRVMSGNAGIACVKLRKAFNLEVGNEEIKKLNQELILLELETRKKMKELITNFIDEDGERVEQGT